MSEEILSTGDIAGLLGVRLETVHKYVSQSRPLDGCRYKDHPFPAPDGYAGRSPWWAARRRNEIIAWSLRRRGRAWSRKELLA